MPYARISLAFDDWPPGDQAAWNAATRKGDPLDDPGLASNWKGKTRNTVMTRYGIWLAHLLESGQLDPNVPPAMRATSEALSGFLADLRRRNLASITIAGYMRDLHEALRVMQPGADLSALDHLLPRLEAVAEPSRDKRTRIVSPLLLLDAAIGEMTMLARLHRCRTSRRTSGQFRDALIIAFLATRPVRLANLAAITLDRHLQKVDDVYWCRFSAAEMKNGRPLAFPMPKGLTTWMDQYLTIHRPLLLRGEGGARLWIATRSTAMTDNTIHCRVTAVTERLVGRSINPHLFRHCIATFIAEYAPEEVRIVSQILGHAALATAEDYYIHAGSISAQRRYLKVLDEIRESPVETKDWS